MNLILTTCGILLMVIWLDTCYPQSVAGEYGMDRQTNLEAFFKYLNENLMKRTASPNSNTPTLVELPAPLTLQSIYLVWRRPILTIFLLVRYKTGRRCILILWHQWFTLSHYPNSFLRKPNDYPYKVVNFAMQSGLIGCYLVPPNERFSSYPITTTNASGTVTATGLYSKPVYTGDKFALDSRLWPRGDYDAADAGPKFRLATMLG